MLKMASNIKCSIERSLRVIDILQSVIRGVKIIRVVVVVLDCQRVEV